MVLSFRKKLVGQYIKNLKHLLGVPMIDLSPPQTLYSLVHSPQRMRPTLGAL